MVTARKVPCCSKARSTAKLAATQKATAQARENVAKGKIPTPKKKSAQKAPAQKASKSPPAKPCMLCGRAAAELAKLKRASKR